MFFYYDIAHVQKVFCCDQDLAMITFDHQFLAFVSTVRLSLISPGISRQHIFQRDALIPNMRFSKS